MNKRISDQTASNPGQTHKQANQFRIPAYFSIMNIWGKKFKLVDFSIMKKKFNWFRCRPINWDLILIFFFVIYIKNEDHCPNDIVSDCKIPYIVYDSLHIIGQTARFLKILPNFFWILATKIKISDHSPRTLYIFF